MAVTGRLPRLRRLVRQRAPISDAQIEWFDAPCEDHMAERFVALGAALQALTPPRPVEDVEDGLGLLSTAARFWTHAEGRGFIVTVDGEDVGRCLAVIDHRSAPCDAERAADSRVGRIGMWECSDEAAGAAMLQAALEYLGVGRCDIVTGPVDLSGWYRCGLRNPTAHEQTWVGEPSGDAASLAAWTRAGFRPSSTLVASHVERLETLVDHGQNALADVARAGIRIRPLKRGHLDAAVADMHGLAVRDADPRGLHTPIDLEEFRALPTVDPRALDHRLTLFAHTAGGRLVGYVVCAPSRIEAAQILDGGGGGLRARMRALQALRSADAFVVHDLRVASSFREHGVATALLASVHEHALDAGYRRATYAPVEAGSPAHRITQMAGPSHETTYTLHEWRTDTGREAAVQRSAEQLQDLLLRGPRGDRVWSAR